MLTILILTLAFAHNSSRKGYRGYKCHVENVSEISGSIRSLNISLEASMKAATKGELNRTQKLITLDCFTPQSLVQVNLLYLEKMHRDWAEQAVKKCTLQSLEVATGAGRKPAVSHRCVLLTHHSEKFQRKLILKETERILSTNATDRLKREKGWIVIKAAIAYILLALLMLELPCPWLRLARIERRWSGGRSPGAAWAALPTLPQTGTEQQPPEFSV